MNAINQIENKIFTLEALLQQVSKWKSYSEKIVFTNGCFDLVHRGHIDYLAKSSTLGSKLIIGLNTDASVSKIKGPSRPLQDQKTRAMLMASLFFVDAVVLFDDDTPYNLIKAIVPDVLVKGADYKLQDIVGYDIVTANGGCVKTIKFLEGFSTSGIVRKILSENKFN
jgi:rfaE bifunctional protein, domain II